MPPKLDLTNQKFEKLLVINQDLTKNKNHTYWYCKCDCGNYTSVCSYNLRKKLTKSCGCLCSELIREKSPRWSGYKHISGAYWHNIKKGACQRNIELKITIQEASDLLEKQNFQCALTGEKIEVSNTYSQKNLQTASLDRIDATKGYTIDNIRWVHRSVNYMKSNYSDQEFIEWCTKVSNNFPE